MAGEKASKQHARRIKLPMMPQTIPFLPDTCSLYCDQDKRIIVQTTSLL